ncbi:MAG TPA: HTH domain-containing protein [Pyrinomonadaceae bacterium]|nr:HTH domain-containing protein [Pyrinomonadaceae bacterium]
MGVLTAVQTVLAEAGEPLHYKEITKRLLNRGLWTTTGQTPDATVNAQLAVDIKRRGKASNFRRADKGVFALRAWTPTNPQPQPTPPTHLSFTDAAEKVLDKYADKSPMHYRAITDRALELGLIATAGKTPEATLYAQIITENQRRTRRGERPRFVRYGKGYVGLSKWKGIGLAFQIEQHNQHVRKKLIQQIGKMPPAEFESLIGALLAKLGFEDVTVTSFKGDGGIDVRGTMVTGDVVRTRMAVQVKRWKANVQSPTVQQVRGSLGAHEQGLIITTSDFSKGARAEAERADATPVALMNGEQLVKLLVENDIGIRRSSYDLIEPEWGENI